MVAGVGQRLAQLAVTDVPFGQGSPNQKKGFNGCQLGGPQMPHSPKSLLSYKKPKEFIISSNGDFF